jgi:hypothetical protein
MAPRFLRSKFAFFLFLAALIPSVCFGAEYALDRGADMYAVTAGIINAFGDLYEDGEGNSSTTILIMPSWARFFAPNFGFGGDFLLMHSKQGDAGTSTLGLGPKAMFFFGGKHSRSYPYLTSGFYYIRNTYDTGPSDYTVSGTRFKFGGGVNILMSPHLGILVEASYNLDNLKAEGAKKSESGNMLIISMGLAGFTF